MDPRTNVPFNIHDHSFDKMIRVLQNLVSKNEDVRFLQEYAIPQFLVPCKPRYFIMVEWLKQHGTEVAKKMAEKELAILEARVFRGEQILTEEITGHIMVEAEVARQAIEDRCRVFASMGLPLDAASFAEWLQSIRSSLENSDTLHMALRKKIADLCIASEIPAIKSFAREYLKQCLSSIAAQENTELKKIDSRKHKNDSVPSDIQPHPNQHPCSGLTNTIIKETEADFLKMVKEKKDAQYLLKTIVPMLKQGPIHRAEARHALEWFKNYGSTPSKGYLDGKTFATKALERDATQVVLEETKNAEATHERNHVPCDPGLHERAWKEITAMYHKSSGPVLDDVYFSHRVIPLIKEEKENEAFCKKVLNLCFEKGNAAVKRRLIEEYPDFISGKPGELTPTAKIGWDALEKKYDKEKESGFDQGISELLHNKYDKEIKHECLAEVLTAGIRKGDEPLKTKAKQYLCDIYQFIEEGNADKCVFLKKLLTGDVERGHKSLASKAEQCDAFHAFIEKTTESSSMDEDICEFFYQYTEEVCAGQGEIINDALFKAQFVPYLDKYKKQESFCKKTLALCVKHGSASVRVEAGKRLADYDAECAWRGMEAIYHQYPKSEWSYGFFVQKVVSALENSKLKLGEKAFNEAFKGILEKCISKKIEPLCTHAKQYLEAYAREKNLVGISASRAGAKMQASANIQRVLVNLYDAMKERVSDKEFLQHRILPLLQVPDPKICEEARFILQWFKENGDEDSKRIAAHTLKKDGKKEKLELEKEKGKKTKTVDRPKPLELKDDYHGAWVEKRLKSIEFRYQIAENEPSKPGFFKDCIAPFLKQHEGMNHYALKIILVSCIEQGKEPIKSHAQQYLKEEFFRIDTDVSKKSESKPDIKQEPAVSEKPENKKESVSLPPPLEPLPTPTETPPATKQKVAGKNKQPTKPFAHVQTLKKAPPRTAVPVFDVKESADRQAARALEAKEHQIKAMIRAKIEANNAVLAEVERQQEADADKETELAQKQAKAAKEQAARDVHKMQKQARKEKERAAKKAAEEAAEKAAEKAAEEKAAAEKAAAEKAIAEQVAATAHEVAGRAEQAAVTARDAAVSANTAEAQVGEVAASARRKAGEETARMIAAASAVHQAAVAAAGAQANAERAAKSVKTAEAAVAEIAMSSSYPYKTLPIKKIPNNLLNFGQRLSALTGQHVFITGSTGPFIYLNEQNQAEEIKQAAIEGRQPRVVPSIKINDWDIRLVVKQNQKNFDDQIHQAQDDLYNQIIREWKDEIEDPKNLHLKQHSIITFKLKIGDDDKPQHIDISIWKQFLSETADEAILRYQRDFSDFAPFSVYMNLTDGKSTLRGSEVCIEALRTRQFDVVDRASPDFLFFEDPRRLLRYSVKRASCGNFTASDNFNRILAITSPRTCFARRLKETMPRNHVSTFLQDTLFSRCTLTEGIEILRSTQLPKACDTHNMFEALTNLVDNDDIENTIRPNLEYYDDPDVTPYARKIAFFVFVLAHACVRLCADGSKKSSLREWFFYETTRRLDLTMGEGPQPDECYLNAVIDTVFDNNIKTIHDDRVNRMLCSIPRTLKPMSMRCPPQPFALTSPAATPPEHYSETKIMYAMPKSICLAPQMLFSQHVARLRTSPLPLPKNRDVSKQKQHLAPARPHAVNRALGPSGDVTIFSNPARRRRPTFASNHNPSRNTHLSKGLNDRINEGPVARGGRNNTRS